ncbi:MAG: zinc ABC transporter substrate-binding protein [Erysipelotrichaceae bacterium]|nr:zinc ABC transporter substrate-binding protein [Erysipelotrichaceae bacterium]
MVNIINSDLFIYVGGESEEWVNDVLKSKDAEGLKYINLLDALGSRALVEEEFGEDDDHEEGHHDEEYDEHIWLSLENASILCEQIAEKIISLDPSCEEKYRANLEEYGHELWLLKREYRDTFAGDGQKVIVVADRFPFAYLVNDYGIEYYAAFSGCSAESEASFETVVNLASKVDEYDLPVILHIESSDGSIAETVRKTTTNKDQQILMLNSLQAVSSEDIRNGVTYLKTMQENLEVLRKALNRE